MPKVLDIETGELVTVPKSKIAGAVSSGRYTFVADETYRLRAHDGTLRDIPGDAATEAIDRQGFTFDDPDFRARELGAEAEREYYEDDKVLTALEGVGRGATLGLTDVLFGDEHTRKRRQYNPVTATVSELGGAVLPAIASGGAGLGASIARATPTGALARGAASIAGKGSVSRAAVGYGLEGAVFSSGQYISDVALGDKKLSAEAFIGEMGHGALWGGGLGGAFTAVGKGARALRSKPDDPRIGTLGGDLVPSEPVASPKLLPDKTVMDKGNLGALEAAAFKAERLELAAAKKAERLELAAAKKADRVAAANRRELAKIDKTIKDPGNEAALRAAVAKDAPKVMKAARVLPKSQRGPKAVKQAKQDLDGTVAGHKKIGEELERVAAEQSSVAAAQGKHPYAQQLDDAVDNYRAHRGRFERWLAEGGIEHKAPSPHTLHHEGNFLEIAERVTGRVGPADDVVRKAAREYGHGIASRERAAGAVLAEGGSAGAAKRAAQKALKVPPESEMNRAMKEIERLGKRLGEPRTAMTAAGKKAVKSGTIDTVAGKKGAGAGRKTKPVVARDTYGWTIPPPGQKNAIDALIDGGALGPMKRGGSLVAPGGKLPLRKLTELEAAGAPRPLTQGSDQFGTRIDDSFGSESAFFGNVEAGVGGRDPFRGPAVVLDDIPADGKLELARLSKLQYKPTPEDKRLAEGLDLIEGLEKSQHELYRKIKGTMQPAQVEKLQQHFSKYETAAGKVEKQKGRFSTFKDALGVMEVMQTLGVPGVPDVDKIPVIGPLLGAYAKYRFAKRALQKGGILKTPEAAVAEKSAKLRDRIADSVERFAGKAKKVKPAAIPAIATVLNTPLFAADQSPKHKRDAKGDRAVKAGIAESQLRFAKRAAEIQAASRIGAEELRARVNVGDEELQQQIEDAYDRKIKFLEGKLPTDPFPPNALGAASIWQPTAAELHSFARSLRAADDPKTIVDDLADGRLTIEAVEAAKAVYPALYEEMRSSIIEKTAELQTTLDYGQRVQLSILFEAAVDPTMSDSFIAFMADDFARKDEEQQPAPQASFAGPGVAEMATLGMDRRAGK